MLFTGRQIVHRLLLRYLLEAALIVGAAVLPALLIPPAMMPVACEGFGPRTLCFWVVLAPWCAFVHWWLWYRNPRAGTGTASK